MHTKSIQLSFHVFIDINRANYEKHYNDACNQSTKVLNARRHAHTLY